MNASSNWSVDMQLDNSTYLYVFQTMIQIQRVMFGVLFVLGMYYCLRIATHSLMHFNFRIIMATTAIYAILFSGSRQSMYILLTVTADLTNRTKSNYLCITLGTIHSMSIVGLICSMFLVGVERHLATIYVYRYESKKRHIGVLMFLIGLIVGCVMAITVNTAKLYTYFDMAKTYQTCIIVELYPDQALGSFGLGITGCLLSAVWQFQLYRRNQSDNAKRVGLTSLTGRFQQVENVHTTRLIYPVMIVYMLMCLLGLALSTTRHCLMRDGNIHLAKIVMQAGYMLIDCFCIFAMGFVLLFHPGLRFNVIQDLCRICGIKVESNRNTRSRRRVTDTVNEGEVYFKQLELYWK